MAPKQMVPAEIIARQCGRRRGCGDRGGTRCVGPRALRSGAALSVRMWQLFITERQLDFSLIARSSSRNARKIGLGSVDRLRLACFAASLGRSMTTPRPEKREPVDGSETAAADSAGPIQCHDRRPTRNRYLPECDTRHHAGGLSPRLPLLLSRNAAVCSACQPGSLHDPRVVARNESGPRFSRSPC